mmetsp:Transcript_25527/g.38257  ORF Transcript_25527/g.38257 Transcript_25527/m.38257 type:complete len:155 (+) Transcript_25527:410-874(+)
MAHSAPTSRLSLTSPNKLLLRLMRESPLHMAVNKKRQERQGKEAGPAELNENNMTNDVINDMVEKIQAITANANPALYMPSWDSTSILWHFSPPLRCQPKYPTVPDSFCTNPHENNATDVRQNADKLSRRTNSRLHGRRTYICDTGTKNRGGDK